jgi:hypothetical protein
VVGTASVDYGGLIIAGAQAAGVRRFYDIRQQVWRAGFSTRRDSPRVEAFADYISYGTPDRAMAFAHDRATECRDEEWRTTVTRHGIASAEELTHLAADWEEWAKDPGAFFAFAWCRVLAWS